MNKIILCFFLTLQSCFAQDLCVNKIENEGVLLKSRMTYQLETCQLDNSSGDLKVKLKIKDAQAIIYEYIQMQSNGYIPSIENQLDINNDGVPDFSLSNGKGKSGDGRDYFIILNKPPYFLKMGDFPALKHDKNRKSILFAIVPGSAENIATRIDYVFDHDHLNEVRTISYSHFAANKFKVTIEDIKYGKTVNAESKIWVESKIVKCMAGGKC